MEFLKVLEEIRNPILDGFFSLVTHLGGDVVAVAIIIVLYWCVNKKLGQRLGFGMILAGLAIQLLKITFRVDRPWVRDPSFNPVESAIAGASGYSFPSGHTGQITYFLAGMASFFVRKTGYGYKFESKKDKLKIILLSTLIIILVAFSRMYLGVHTPVDVFTAATISIVLVFITDLLFDKFFCNDKNVILGALFIVIYSLAGAFYSISLFNSEVIVYDYAADSVKLCGAAIGFALGWFIETKYINFVEKGISLKMQIAKVCVGIITTFGIKELLKVIGNLISEESLIIDFVRYIFVIIWAVGIYPIFIKKYFSKKENE